MRGGHSWPQLQGAGGNPKSASADAMMQGFKRLIAEKSRK
jgi:hypothetical protein